jgi:protein SCO1/2
MKNLRFVLWGAVALAFIGFIIISLPKKDTTSSSIAMPLAGFNQGSHFTLTDHNGDVFNSDDKIADDHYAMIFFGFTHCPVICPTELQKFSEIMDGLPTNIADKIHPLFITIDPERDTVKVLKDYVPLFHPSIVGLTGDVKAVQETLKSWKVFYSKVDDPQFTEYTMDHSTYAYLVDHNMTIKSLFRMKNTSDEIIDNLSKTLKKD